MSHFAQVSAEVSAAISSPREGVLTLLETAKEVSVGMRQAAAKDRDSEWQRVNSYLADVLKDVHVLYSKLARLQGDFAGTERDQLEKVSENILDLGEELSHFMKDFHTGRADMVGQTMFGDTDGAPEGTPPPMVPSEFEGEGEGGLGEEEFETEITLEEEGEFSEFEEDEGE